MKRKICTLLSCILLMALTACSGNGKGNTSGSSDTIARILNPMEYTIYVNTFLNEQGDDYTGKSSTKEGVFSILYDSFNDTTRYYVWGYSDETLCCDWQWPAGTSSARSTRRRPRHNPGYRRWYGVPAESIPPVRNTAGYRRKSRIFCLLRQWS